MSMDMFAYLVDPEICPGGNVILLVGPPMADRLKGRNQTNTAKNTMTVGSS